MELKNPVNEEDRKAMELAFQKAIKSSDWKDWVALRCACSIGTEYKYSENQISYHYIKDKKYLKL